MPDWLIQLILGVATVGWGAYRWRVSGQKSATIERAETIARLIAEDNETLRAERDKLAERTRRLERQIRDLGAVPVNGV